METESRLSIISGGNIFYRGLSRKITGVGGGTWVLPTLSCGGIVMQEHRINPKCGPKAKETVGCANVI